MNSAVDDVADAMNGLGLSRTAPISDEMLATLIGEMKVKGKSSVTFEELNRRLENLYLEMSTKSANTPTTPVGSSKNKADSDNSKRWTGSTTSSGDSPDFTFKSPLKPFTPFKEKGVDNLSQKSEKASEPGYAGNFSADMLNDNNNTRPLRFGTSLFSDNSTGESGFDSASANTKSSETSSFINPAESIPGGLFNAGDLGKDKTKKTSRRAKGTKDKKVKGADANDFNSWFWGGVENANNGVPEINNSIPATEKRGPFSTSGRPTQLPFTQPAFSGPETTQLPENFAFSIGSFEKPTKAKSAKQNEDIIFPTNKSIDENELLGKFVQPTVESFGIDEKFDKIPSIFAHEKRDVNNPHKLSPRVKTSLSRENSRTSNTLPSGFVNEQTDLGNSDFSFPSQTPKVFSMGSTDILDDNDDVEEVAAEMDIVFGKGVLSDDDALSDASEETLEPVQVNIEKTAKTDFSFPKHTNGPPSSRQAERGNTFSDDDLYKNTKSAEIPTETNSSNDSSAETNPFLESLKKLNLDQSVEFNIGASSNSSNVSSNTRSKRKTPRKQEKSEDVNSGIKFPFTGTNLNTSGAFSRPMTAAPPSSPAMHTRPQSAHTTSTSTASFNFQSSKSNATTPKAKGRVHSSGDDQKKQHARRSQSMDETNHTNSQEVEYDPMKSFSEKASPRRSVNSTNNEGEMEIEHNNGERKPHKKESNGLNDGNSNDEFKSYDSLARLADVYSLQGKEFYTKREYTR